MSERIAVTNGGSTYIYDTSEDPDDSTEDVSFYDDWDSFLDAITGLDASWRVEYDTSGVPAAGNWLFMQAQLKGSLSAYFRARLIGEFVVDQDEESHVLAAYLIAKGETDYEELICIVDDPAELYWGEGATIDEARLKMAKHRLQNDDAISLDWVEEYVDYARMGSDLMTWSTTYGTTVYAVNDAG